MTADVIPGPPCDICGEEFAAMSLLSYGDYSQVKTGVNCAPNFLRTIADSIDGRTTAEPDGQAAEVEQHAPATAEQAAHDAAIMVEQGREWTDQAAAIPADESGDPEWHDAPEQGSAKDHWASTTHVRRSTHGHRRTSSATGEPRSEPAE